MNKKIILLVLSIFIVAFAIGSVIAEEQKESAEIKMLSEDTLKNGDNIELQLVDAKGNPIASQNLNISFEANGKLENYSVVTDKDGKAFLVLFNEELGDHKVIVNYSGNEKFNPFKLETSIKIVEGESTSEDTEDESTASTVQYDHLLPLQVILQNYTTVRNTTSITIPTELFTAVKVTEPMLSKLIWHIRMLNKELQKPEAPT